MTLRSCFLPMTGLCLLLTACSWEGSVYHHFAHPVCQPWTKCDTLHFADTLYFDRDNAPGYFFLETILRHDNLYPYEEIYINAAITVGFTNDTTAIRSNHTINDATAIRSNHTINDATASHSSHTFHIQLVNNKHHWSGKGWGSLRTAESTPLTISLPKKLYRQACPIGNDSSDTTRLMLPFHIAITSAMQDEELNGCESIGIRLYVGQWVRGQVPDPCVGQVPVP